MLCRKTINKFIVNIACKLTQIKMIIALYSDEKNTKDQTNEEQENPLSIYEQCIGISAE